MLGGRYERLAFAIPCSTPLRDSKITANGYEKQEYYTTILVLSVFWIVV